MPVVKDGSAQFYQEFAEDHRGDIKVETEGMNRRKEEAKFQHEVTRIFFETAALVLSGESTKDIH